MLHYIILFPAHIVSFFLSLNFNQQIGNQKNFLCSVFFQLLWRVDDVGILRHGHASAHKMLLRKTIKFL